MLFKVTFQGKWADGYAIVEASDVKEARQLVKEEIKKDQKEYNWHSNRHDKKMKVTELKTKGKANILDFHNGNRW